MPGHRACKSSLAHTGKPADEGERRLIAATFRSQYLCELLILGLVCDGVEFVLKRQPCNLGASSRDVTVAFLGPTAENGRMGVAPFRNIIGPAQHRHNVNNKLDIHARPTGTKRVVDRDAALLVVEDHGVGLRPGEAANVFTRFWRADPARARTTGGTGLGLSISLEDARLHNGWLQAWGERGVGSRFRLTLPQRAGETLHGSPLALSPSEET